MRFFLIILIVFFHSFNLYSYTKDKVYKITILHTNDQHGHFWPNQDGEGGMAARATLIRQIRNEVEGEGGHVLLLDAGDVNTGTPQSNVLDAEPDFLGMKLLGYDVMTIGNHEFDKPLTTLFKQQAWAGFPFISASVFKHDCVENIFPTHIKKQFDDLNITIMGLTTEDSLFKSNPQTTSELCFKPAIDVAKKLVPTLRQEADVLIALTHIGYYANENNGLEAPGDVTLARQVPGIDLIVGGHTHTKLLQPDIQNGTVIVQADEWGKYLGRTKMEFLNGKLILKEYELVPVNQKDSNLQCEADSEVQELLRPFKEKGDAGLLVEIGNAEVEFVGRREVVRFQETNLGNLIARAYRDFYKADIGIVNSGGLRDSINPGRVTYESVLKVLPFAGEIVLASIKGSELQTYLEFVLTGPLVGSGGFAQVSGVSAVIEKDTKKVLDLKINDEAIQNEKIYKIALPEFVANGGDKYPKLNFVKFGNLDADIIKNYIVAKKTLSDAEFAIKHYVKIQEN